MSIDSAVASPSGNSNDKARLARAIAKAQASPGSSLALYHLAEEYRVQGCNDAWRTAIHAALNLPHFGSRETYFRARAKLLMGDWSGWSDYEVRQDKPGEWFARQPMAQQIRWRIKQWDGIEDLRNLTLLAVGEKGFGDVVQMLRYLPTLIGKSMHLVVLCRRELVDLIQYNVGQSVTVQAFDDSNPISADRYVWLMSMPALTGRLPPFVPLRAPAPMGRPIDSTDRLRIGLCWAGRPTHTADHRRSMPLASLERLINSQAFAVHSLQVGQRAAEATAFPQLLPAPTSIKNFADTANAILSLDCVVTVDTAVAHLSGSLGVNTYLLLSAGADWRWGLTDSTDWYPTMRLIRQRRLGDWSDVVDNVVSRLVEIGRH
jgi:hypothetical protein